MPYLTQEQKNHVDNNLLETVTAGELTYALTQVALGYLRIDPFYADFATAIGCLEATKLELYRRMVGPYEDGKIKVNGDVYPTKKNSKKKKEVVSA